MYTDPIADFLTRIRNAAKAGHKVVTIPSSNTKKEMSRILMEKGYILNYKVEDDNKQGMIKIALRYNGTSPAFRKMERISKPGLRQYANRTTLPRVLNGLGVAILSTSKGVMTDKEARTQNVGGEVLCYVY
tara:strand:+ start:174 stop:566 length:393 start_codon:yes stop_codon:yes gene_type:complete